MQLFLKEQDKCKSKRTRGLIFVARGGYQALEAKCNESYVFLMTEL